MKNVVSKLTSSPFLTIPMTFVVAVLFTSCVTTSRHLAKSVVIGIADRVALKNGYSPNKFEKRAEYNFVRADNTWVVFYDIKPDSHGMVPTGGGFTVHVKDDTKETWLIPGR